MSTEPTSSEILSQEVPEPPSQHEPPSDRQEGTPKWMAPVAIGALVLGLAGLGVGAYALATMPAKTLAPRPCRPRRSAGASRAGRAGRTAGSGRGVGNHRRHDDR